MRRRPVSRGVVAAPSLGPEADGRPDGAQVQAFVPGPREAWLCAAAIFVLAAAIRTFAASTVSFPVPEDTAYYAGVARNLVAGRGLVFDALWSYQTPPLVVPREAFEVWLPLPSLLAAIPIWLAGAANWFRAAQAMAVVVSSLGAVLAWRLGADVAAELRLPVGRARTLGVGCGVVASFLGPLVVFGTLPDSTALFATLSLAACLLMTRITAPASTVSGLTSGRRLLRRSDLRLVALGVILGLAALTRSEALWLGLTWLAVAWLWTRSSSGRRPSRRERLRLVLVPAFVAILVFLPWAIRDWMAFGSPLPGQTLANALSIHPSDIYAYQGQPTLARYLAQGPKWLVGIRITALFHDLVEVLIIPGFPIGLIGLLALPLSWRLNALRPLLLVSTVTFTITTLIFPVSTLWGTFLHAAGAIFVLLIVSCLVALDALIAVIHRVRHWWRPVAWLGPALATAVAIPLLAVSMFSLDSTADATSTRYDALVPALANAGISLDDSGPVITNNPIWLADATGVTALALPQESPTSVVTLARHFHSKLLIVARPDAADLWPWVLDTQSADRECFSEVYLTDNSAMMAAPGSPLDGIRVFRIGCP